VDIQLGSSETNIGSNMASWNQLGFSGTCGRWWTYRSPRNHLGIKWVL